MQGAFCNHFYEVCDLVEEGKAEGVEFWMTDIARGEREWCMNIG